MAYKHCFTKRVYIQPPVREPFRPESNYTRPNIPIDDATTYRYSYFGTDAGTMANCRLPPATPAISSLNVDKSVTMDPNTTHKLSYIPHGYIKPEPSFPVPRLGLGDGRMQDITTTRHDYVPKTAQRQSILTPDDHFVASMQPLSSDTTNRLSYPGQYDIERTRGFQPAQTYQLPNVPIDSNTTQRLSYTAVEVSHREIPPWAIQPSFQKSNVPMEHLTTHELSFFPPGKFVDSTDCHYCPTEKCLIDEKHYPKAGL